MIEYFHKAASLHHMYKKLFNQYKQIMQQKFKLKEQRKKKKNIILDVQRKRNIKESIYNDINYQ